MKKILNSLFVLFALVAIVGCDKDTTGDVSYVTTYASFTLEGDTKMILPVGTTYVEPGYSAVEGDTDITDQVEVDATAVDTTTPGVYPIYYSAVNSDGYAASVTRTVMVYDATPSPLKSGYWTVLEGSNVSGSEFSGTTITIYQTGADTFSVSCFIGAYYEQIKGYGALYAMAGSFKLNSDNTIEVLSSGVAGWGDDMDSCTNASFDPATGILKWDTSYVGGAMIFHVEMSL